MQVVGKHAGVEFGYDYSLVAAEDFGGVGGQGVDVAEVGEGHGGAFVAELGACGEEVSVGSTPAYDEGVGVGAA